MLGRGVGAARIHLVVQIKFRIHPVRGSSSDEHTWMNKLSLDDLLAGLPTSFDLLFLVRRTSMERTGRIQISELRTLSSVSSLLVRQVVTKRIYR